MAITPSIFDGKVVSSPPFLARGFDQDLHYVIPFEKAEGGRHPEGYSGAATWWESDKPMKVWKPHFKFAGICTHCYKDGLFEKVVKASAVRRFVEEVLEKIQS